MVAAWETLGNSKTTKVIPRKIIVLFVGNLGIEIYCIVTPVGAAGGVVSGSSSLYTNAPISQAEP